MLKGFTAAASLLCCKKVSKLLSESTLSSLWREHPACGWHSLWGNQDHRLWSVQNHGWWQLRSGWDGPNIARSRNILVWAGETGGVSLQGCLWIRLLRGGCRRFNQLNLLFNCDEKLYNGSSPFPNFNFSLWNIESLQFAFLGVHPSHLLVSIQPSVTLTWISHYGWMDLLDLEC